jgi:hypothetical protein
MKMNRTAQILLISLVLLSPTYSSEIKDINYFIQEGLTRMGYGDYYYVGFISGINFNWFYQDVDNFGMFRTAYDVFNKLYKFNQTERKLYSNGGFLTEEYSGKIRFMDYVLSQKEMNRLSLEVNVLAEDLRYIYEKHFGLIAQNMVNQSCAVLNSKRGFCEPSFNILSYITEFQLAYNWTCEIVFPYVNVKVENLKCMPEYGQYVWNAFLKWKHATSELGNFMSPYSEAKLKLALIKNRLEDPTLDPKSMLIKSYNPTKDTPSPGFSVSQSVKEIFDGLNSNNSQLVFQNESMEINIPTNLDDYLRGSSSLIPVLCKFPGNN